MPRESVILVDEKDRRLGICEKVRAHEEGKLHRALSIFLVDQSGRILLQRRDLGKYHSGGLWANSCCGHPRPGEPTLTAAKRRLNEELGIQVELSRAFTSRYTADVSDGMQENELVHVFFGSLESRPKPNPAEVMDVSVVSFAELASGLKTNADRFAPWLHHYVAHHSGELVRGIENTARS